MGDYKIVGNPKGTREESLMSLQRSIERRKILEAKKGIIIDVTTCFVEEDTDSKNFLAYAHYDLLDVDKKVQDPFLIIGESAYSRKEAVKLIESRIRLREGELRMRLEYPGVTIKEDVGNGTFQATTRCVPRNYTKDEQLSSERLVYNFVPVNAEDGRPSWNRT